MDASAENRLEKQPVLVKLAVTFWGEISYTKAVDN